MSNPFDNGFKPKRTDPDRKPCDRCSWQPWESEVWKATVVVCAFIWLAMFVVHQSRLAQDNQPAPVPAHHR